MVAGPWVCPVTSVIPASVRHNRCSATISSTASTPTLDNEFGAPFVMGAAGRAAIVRSHHWRMRGRAERPRSVLAVRPAGPPGCRLAPDAHGRFLSGRGGLGCHRLGDGGLLVLAASEPGVRKCDRSRGLDQVDAGPGVGSIRGAAVSAALAEAAEAIRTHWAFMSLGALEGLDVRQTALYWGNAKSLK